MPGSVMSNTSAVLTMSQAVSAPEIVLAATSPGEVSASGGAAGAACAAAVSGASKAVISAKWGRRFLWW